MKDAPDIQVSFASATLRAYRRLRGINPIGNGARSVMGSRHLVRKSSTNEMGVSRYQSRRAARNPRHLRHVLRHGEAHAAKGLTAFGTSLTRNSLFLRPPGLIRSGCNGCGPRFRWQDLTCGQAKPVFEARLAEWRGIAWKECVLAKLHAVVERLRVRDNLARILSCG